MQLLVFTLLCGWSWNLCSADNLHHAAIKCKHFLLDNFIILLDKITIFFIFLLRQNVPDFSGRVPLSASGKFPET